MLYLSRGTQEGGLSGGGSGRRRANGTANGAASRSEERRERAAPVLGAVLGAVKPVTLRVGAGCEVRRASGRQTVAHILVRRVLNGRDEVAEQRLGRRRLDAVGASVRVLERLREQLVLSRLDERVAAVVCSATMTARSRSSSTTTRVSAMPCVARSTNESHSIPVARIAVRLQNDIRYTQGARPLPAGQEV